MKFEVININSPNYPTNLINYFGKSAPELYIKGNKKILNLDSIAVVGSRNASEIALRFTENIVKIAVNQNKVVISGFAKGVDRQALESTIKYKGKSIIVLPKGILTFNHNFNDEVLILSTFPPNIDWNSKFAMGRNRVIYGLASEVFIAEAKPSKNSKGIETKGGTWAGALDGLKKGKKLYIRNPEPKEINDNYKLILKGVTPVDIKGNEVIITEKYSQLKLF